MIAYVFLIVSILFTNVPGYRISRPWVRSGRIEGDMILSNGRNGVINPAYRWPDKTVCYQFSGTFTQSEIDTIYNTVNTAFSDTCVKFKHCNCNGNYVNISSFDVGCYADVGYLGGAQRLNLGQDCVFRETIIHEFTHSLGFYHEQSSTNRDSYIRILYENIELDYLGDFAIVEASTSFGQPYDYCSIMHYDMYAFTKNGEPTIEPLCFTTCDIGFEPELSQVDKNKINIMYDCGEDYPIIPVPDPCSRLS